jgi:hypothetical protein
VGGVKKIEALGAFKLMSGGSASLPAVDDLHQATGRDLNLVVGQKHNATVGGDMQERIEGLRESVARISQKMQAPKNWIDSESESVPDRLRHAHSAAGDEYTISSAHAFTRASAESY